MQDWTAQEKNKILDFNESVLIVNRRVSARGIQRQGWFLYMITVGKVMAFFHAHSIFRNFGHAHGHGHCPKVRQKIYSPFPTYLVLDSLRYNNSLSQASWHDTFGHFVLFLCLYLFCFLKLLSKTNAADFKACFTQILVKLPWSFSNCYRFFNQCGNSISLVFNMRSYYF